MYEMGSTCPIERANMGGCPPTEKHCESLSHGATAAADCSAVDWSVSHYIATTEKTRDTSCDAAFHQNSFTTYHHHHHHHHPDYYY